MRIFTLQPIEGTGNSIISACIAMAPGRLSFKTLTPKKRMQRLSIALAIVKTTIWNSSNHIFVVASNKMLWKKHLTTYWIQKSYIILCKINTIYKVW